uniref:Gastric triacylglycerol lipase-like n=2 Tax=Hirondellea gigas TaxID=1518452 RepID=A0A6A7G7I7_9CRUS
MTHKHAFTYRLAIFLLLTLTTSAIDEHWDYFTDYDKMLSDIRSKLENEYGKESKTQFNKLMGENIGKDGNGDHLRNWSEDDDFEDGVRVSGSSAYNSRPDDDVVGHDSSTETKYGRSQTASDDEGDGHLERERLVRVLRSAAHDTSFEDNESGLEAVMRRFSFTNNLNRLHSIMKIPELIRAQGYPSEIHKVVTRDGYILELHRIPGPRSIDQMVLPPRKSRKRAKKFQKRSTEVPSRRRRGKMSNQMRTLKKNAKEKNTRMPKPSTAKFQKVASINSIRHSLLSSLYNISDTNSDFLFNLLNYPGENPSLSSITSTAFKNTSKHSRRLKRTIGGDFLSSFGLTNPFRGITNLALPLLNKPSLSESHAKNNRGNKHGTRLVKLIEPSPPRPKSRLFKNSSSSIDFSARRDFEVSKFFGNSRGDSGASGKPVALLHHGLMSSSANFVLNDAHEALAYLLADAGYDVWLANWRGNSYSRGHVYLDPNHSDYWNFSLDEVIRYDIPSIFDYILSKTRQPDLYYIGHSLGCVMFWGATNFYPSLSDKVRLMVAMAPAGYMEHSEGLMKKMALFARNNYRLLEALGIRELLVPNAVRTTIANTLCGPQNPFMSICYALLPLYIGEVRGSHDPYYTDVFISHFPGGTSSLRILAQFGQYIGAGGMQMFDFGAKENRRRYGRAGPPKYSFKTVTCPVAVMYGLGDTVTTAKDVQLCAQSLPNLVLNQRVSDPAFNHIDFFFSERATDLVYKPILQLLRSY